MLQPGTIFDSRYELVRMIGRGGFADVWLVKDTLSGMEEALKIYAPGSGMDEDGLKIFAKELSVVHDLHHPHLLTPNMLGQYERQPYLILPYCPNGSLDKKVGQCTEGEAWQILEHVASGLAYLHEQGVVHQDIKPDNILMDTKGNYVITDFGISLRAQSTLRQSMRVQADFGTMAYMAPERFSVEPNPMSANDIWSLGAMMFELIEGKVPFGEYGGGMQKGGADIPTMHADVSDNLKQVIRSLLALKAEDRPTAAKLVEVAKSKGPLSQPKDSEDDDTTSSFGMVLACVVVLILCFVLFYAIVSSGNNSDPEQEPPISGDTAGVHDPYADPIGEEPQKAEEPTKNEQTNFYWTGTAAGRPCTIQFDFQTEQGQFTQDLGKGRRTVRDLYLNSYDGYNNLVLDAYDTNGNYASQFSGTMTEDKRSYSGRITNTQGGYIDFSVRY